MPDLDVKQILDQLSVDGYAAATGDPKRVEFAFALARIGSQVTQGRGQKVNSLSPLSKERAPAKSLSAVFGLGAQPLHTDGAHLPEPPDIIVLFCETTSSTPTVVWKRPVWPPEFVRYGLFTVRGNGASFIAPAFDRTRTRFDPVCMSPADAYATEAVSYFAEQRAEAYVHQWDEPNTMLFIDNRNALHAREAILDEDDAKNRKIDRLAFKVESKE